MKRLSLFMRPPAGHHRKTMAGEKRAAVFAA